ncbi:MAG: hypothetical protein AAF960_27400 [Bacteroidota bacterium]
MKKWLLLSLIFAFTSTQSILAQMEMTNAKMEKILHQIGDNVEGVLGNWQVIYGEQILFVLTDETHNRMRIFTPITEQKDLEGDELEKMLEANFHAALDAKYALYSGFIVSLFTHPLRELTTAQFKDAMKQVAVAGQNFGTTYSSTDLIFGGGEAEEESPQKDKKVNQKPIKKS